MNFNQLLLSLVVVSLVSPKSVAGGARAVDDASRCLEISQTEPNEYSERFHHVKNACPYDVVIFYCTVRDSEMREDFLTGDCRAGRAHQLAAFTRAMKEMGHINLEAPGSPRVAAKISDGYLPGHAPLAAYVIGVGDAFVSATTASVGGTYRSVLVPSACRSDAYQSRKCKPDATAVFREAGKPGTTTKAIEALQRLGFTLQ